MNQQQVYQRLRQTLGQHLSQANRWQIDNSTLAKNYQSLSNGIRVTKE